MNEIEASVPDEDARRIEVVRSLCQGAGWTEHTAVERAEDLKVLGDFTTEQWDDALESAFELMPDNQYTAAIGNALASQEGKPNLTERRMAFLKEHGMTYRTLVRHEQDGAELLVKYLDLVKSLSKKDWSAPVDEEDPDIELLRQRIVKLEERLEEAESVSEQIEELQQRIKDLEITWSFDNRVIGQITQKLTLEGIIKADEWLIDEEDRKRVGEAMSRMSHWLRQHARES